MERTLTIRVGREEKERMAGFAREHGMTMSELIRAAVAKAIEEGRR